MNTKKLAINTHGWSEESGSLIFLAVFRFTISLSLHLFFQSSQQPNLLFSSVTKEEKKKKSINLTGWWHHKKKEI